MHSGGSTLRITSTNFIERIFIWVFWKFTQQEPPCIKIKPLSVIYKILHFFCKLHNKALTVSDFTHQIELNTSYKNSAVYHTTKPLWKVLCCCSVVRSTFIVCNFYKGDKINLGKKIDSKKRKANWSLLSAPDAANCKEYQTGHETANWPQISRQLKLSYVRFRQAS